MRPVRLEMEGFMAFRERTVVDFAGVELFALTGPTGAGKSSVIDAMIFALYGTIPRFDDLRLVGAVVSQGRPEGRVRLDFEVGGQRWSAVRVVRVRDGKATTKEARLERGGEVVAGNAKDLEVEVTALLGLSAAQFTTCVVLPQGQFARFLQAKPADRQDLLVRLLELGLYDALRDAAGLRAGRLEGELAALRLRLEALDAATPEAVAAEQERLAELDRLLAAIDSTLPELDVADRRRDDLLRALEELRWQARLLDQVQVPAGVERLAEQVEEVRALVAAADEAEVAAMAALAEAEAAREGAGGRAPLEAWLTAHDEQPAVETARRDAEAALADAQARHSTAAQAAEASVAGARAAEAEYERTVADNRAAALRARLAPGEPCPVCDQVVLTIPTYEDPAEVGAARQARDHAVDGEAAAARAAQALEVAVARAHERVVQADAQLQRLAARLAEAPDREQVLERLAVVGGAERRLDEARSTREQAMVARRRAGDAAIAAAEAERGAWAAFDRERDSVAPLGPPPAERTSLRGAWTGLAAWSAERRTGLATDEAGLAADITVVEAERGAVVGALDRLVADAGLTAGRRPHRDVAVEARVRTEHTLSVLREGLAERERLAEAAADGAARCPGGHGAQAGASRQPVREVGAGPGSAGPVHGGDRAAAAPVAARVFVGSRRSSRLRGGGPPQRRRDPPRSDALRRRDLPGVAGVGPGPGRAGRSGRSPARRPPPRGPPRIAVPGRGLRHAGPGHARRRRGGDRGSGRGGKDGRLGEPRSGAGRAGAGAVRGPARAPFVQHRASGSVTEPRPAWRTPWSPRAVESGNR